MARRAERSEPNTIKVKIAPLFGEVKEFVLETDSTVEELLEVSENKSDSEVRVTTADGENQGVIDNDYVLEDGDIVTVISEGKVEAGR